MGGLTSWLNLPCIILPCIVCSCVLCFHSNGYQSDISICSRYACTHILSQPHIQGTGTYTSWQSGSRKGSVVRPSESKGVAHATGGDISSRATQSARARGMLHARGSGTSLPCCFPCLPGHRRDTAFEIAKYRSRTGLHGPWEIGGCLWYGNKGRTSQENDTTK